MSTSHDKMQSDAAHPQGSMTSGSMSSAPTSSGSMTNGH
jgi:hypothetical protein